MPPIKILFFTAEPTDADRLRIGEEFRDIYNCIQQSTMRDQFSLEMRTSTRPGDISTALHIVEPRIVHFSGHGIKSGELCFEDGTGNIQTVQPKFLANLFKMFSDRIQCVILNACFSKKQAKEIAQHIDFVIGIDKKISDHAAISFSIGFYKALGAGRSFEDSFIFGLTEMQLQNKAKHFVPILYKKVPKSTPVPSSNNTYSQIDSQPQFPHYSNLFQISTLTLPYIVIIGCWRKGCSEYYRGNVECNTNSAEYCLPEEFQIYANLYSDIPRDIEPKCRLCRFDCHLTAKGLPHNLIFTFQKIEYLDYLMSGEHLDDRVPATTEQTFRDKYASSIELHDFSKSQLTNICGVGIFIITRDNKIVIAKHSHHVRVWSDVLSYSASGTMSWGVNVNIFDEVKRECYEEIGHTINMDTTTLFGFGIDAKKLYCQYSFFEFSSLSFDDISRRAIQAEDYQAEVGELIGVNFDLDTVVDLIKHERWEPAAAAGMLTLCTKEFGLEEVERAFDPKFVRKNLREEMTAEWKKRAERPEPFTVMSARYPFQRCAEESQKYVQAVTDFIGEDIDNKNVLEIGCGTGRFTELLVSHAKEVTCVDLCEEMIEINKRRLFNKTKQAKYLHMFAQDYKPAEKHDVVISSLVLSHNVDEDAFHQLIKAMCSSGNIIFLFEHIDAGSQVSAYTNPRTERELLLAFQEFRVRKRFEYRLFTDNILFLKLIPKD